MNALFCLCHLFDRAMSHDTCGSKGNSERYNVVCAPVEESDQPALSRSLIRVFDGSSMDSQGSNISSGEKLRL